MLTHSGWQVVYYYCNLEAGIKSIDVKALDKQESVKLLLSVHVLLHLEFQI